MLPCVIEPEEPANKRKREEDSPQTNGDKSYNLKAKRLKKIWKARVGKYYRKGELLGQGGYGSVYAGTRLSDGLPVALKYVRKDEEEELNLPGLEDPMPKEVGLFKMVNTPSTHANILKLYDWFDRPASYVMAMERPNPCQDLFEYCQEQGGALNEDQARNIAQQLLGALQHCHDCGVVHRDVKPENILIQPETQEIKLIDFGCGGSTEAHPIHRIRRFKDFVCCCLRPRAEDRTNLEQLQFHPWLHQSC
ncbi:hypothetical protein SKAU_G00409980 [Synaphobranchus kaupii]|uniref:non-specific serine/threonine protein kinase n=1 Tax=Synaphobranchus kaupii TaxID=118154 RepID=A0A9Q1E7H8_SYNKA|nr:hypothetical protein SKAU_G00409980 [Synaphobranchus kaupii]